MSKKSHTELPQPTHPDHYEETGDVVISEDKVFEYLIDCVDEHEAGRILEELSSKLPIDRVLATLFYAAALYLRNSSDSEDNACTRHAVFRNFSHAVLHARYQLEEESEEEEEEKNEPPASA